MAKKYIEAEKLKEKIQPLYENAKKSAHFASQTGTSSDCAKYDEAKSTYEHILWLIDSLQQDQPEFPTTDEEIEIFLATHPKVEVPNKYKTPDWLWKKQEQPEVELEEEMEKVGANWPFPASFDGYAKEWVDGLMEECAKHFYELGLKAKEESK